MLIHHIQWASSLGLSPIPMVNKQHQWQIQYLSIHQVITKIHKSDIAIIKTALIEANLKGLMQNNRSNSPYSILTYAHLPKFHLLTL